MFLAPFPRLVKSPSRCHVIAKKQDLQGSPYSGIITKPRWSAQPRHSQGGRRPARLLSPPAPGSRLCRPLQTFEGTPDKAVRGTFLFPSSLSLQRSGVISCSRALGACGVSTPAACSGRQRGSPGDSAAARKKAGTAARDRTCLPVPPEVPRPRRQLPLRQAAGWRSKHSPRGEAAPGRRVRSPPAGRGAVPPEPGGWSPGCRDVSGAGQRPFRHPEPSVSGT